MWQWRITMAINVSLIGDYHAYFKERYYLLEMVAVMKTKSGKIGDTYNATQRRVNLLAKHIFDALKAEQALCQSRGNYFNLKLNHVINAINGFVDPKAFKHPNDLFKK